MSPLIYMILRPLSETLPTTLAEDAGAYSPPRSREEAAARQMRVQQLTRFFKRLAHA